VLPFEFGALERTVRGYTENIQKQAQQMQVQKRPGTLDLREVQLQLTRLDTASKAYEEQLTLAMKHTPPLPADRLAKANQALQKAEGALLSAAGLPGREWYQHQLYAPGLYTGYDAKTLPGIREAVEAQHWEEANQEARQVAQALRALAAQVDEATALLK
jgi:N-acetylated-alpha-linked acidic dipeptidase